MESIAGQMKMDLGQFYEITPRQFQNYFDGWDSVYKQEWERTRIIAFYSALTGLKKGVQPDKLIKFPWDNDDKIKGDETPANMPTIEEIEQSRLFWENQDKKEKLHG
tara:strand:- start:7700 stop:8020 length:321 start_codon:yes stop_codon:yes gene_type:complete